MNFWLTFISGIIASFTPCVIVLYPVVLYRFFKKEHNHYRDFALFIVGFLLSFLLFGLLMHGLLSSPVSNGFRLLVGALFVVLGILSLMNRINPLNFPIIKNSFLLGAIFALVISFSPCTIPYLGLLALEQNAWLIINFLFFGIGLLMPSIAFAIFGQQILNFSNKGGKSFEIVNKIMSVVLIATGIYMIISMTNFGRLDLYLAGIMMLLIFGIIIKSFFIIYGKTDFLKIKNIILLLALLLIVIATITHCNYHISNYIGFEEEVYSCGDHVAECEICTRCVTTFGAAVLIGIIAIWYSKSFGDEKIKFKRKNG